jgi:hypothetical protein
MIDVSRFVLVQDRGLLQALINNKKVICIELESGLHTTRFPYLSLESRHTLDIYGQ